MRWRFIPLALVLVCVAGLEASADVILLKDGRIIEGRPMERQSGGIKVKFENGEVLVPDKMIQESILEKAPPYEPKTDEEREKMAKGLVLFEGKWVKPKRRAAIIAKRMAERREMIEEIREHSVWRNRYKEKTKHFEFEHTLPPHIFAYYRDLMEAYYKEFAKRWKLRQPKDLGRLKVCFYTNIEDFHQIGGVSGGVQGYFRFVEPLELNFYYNRLDPNFTEQVMYHEVSHYCQKLLNPKFSMPHFPSESVAEYSTGKFDPRTKKLKVGQILEGRLTEIQNDIAAGEMMGLRKLVSNKMYEHYNWGWSLAHFLMNDDRYKKKFNKFVMNLARGKNVPRISRSGGLTTMKQEQVWELFKKALGLKNADAVNTLEREWHEYVKTNLKLITSTGLAKAANAAKNTNRPIRAKRLFKEAIKAGTTSPMVYFRYADLLMSDGKHDAAVEQLRKAVELDPLAGSFYAALARALKRTGEKDEAKRLLNLARELDPDNPYLANEIERLLESN